ncbi:MAG: acyl-ACP--UDP-N-acetylglucosamine O-acyltransferase [Verrucomicrobiota bacterium]|nr:acyl-ACP--UDP-N-acetylglucosamine O-acyltransferase [Verrucomicrobiota bacterium]
MNNIHKTAVISPNAKVHSSVKIGPYSIIDADVKIGKSCCIGPHVHITGKTQIGENTEIHTGAVIGDKPQDIDFSTENSYTKIGNDCVIREYVTIHRGSEEQSSTVLGNSIMLMAFSHVGHDCIVGNNTVLVNGTLLAGHVQIAENVILSANCVVHQFVRIGRLTMVSAYARIVQDITPFCLLAEGDRIYGPNSIGLKRAGIAIKARKAIKKTVKTLFFSDLSQKEALDQITQEFADIPEIEELVEFVETSKRGLMSGRRRRDK